MSKEMFDELIDSPAKAELLLEGGGFAMIYGLDGAPLCTPLAETEEGILYADIDLGVIGVAKAAYDPVGHYSRPDVLRLLVNREPMTRVHYVQPQPLPVTSVLAFGTGADAARSEESPEKQGDK
jgi:nitrilase